MPTRGVGHTELLCCPWFLPLVLPLVCCHCHFKTSWLLGYSCDLAHSVGCGEGDIFLDLTSVNRQILGQLFFSVVILITACRPNSLWNVKIVRPVERLQSTVYNILLWIRSNIFWRGILFLHLPSPVSLCSVDGCLANNFLNVCICNTILFSFPVSCWKSVYIFYFKVT